MPPSALPLPTLCSHTSAPSLSGSMRPGGARLLADHEHGLAIRQVAQDRRVAEIEVGTADVRTVVARGRPAAAADEERVVRRELMRPHRNAGLQIERHDRIARLGRRERVGVAGGDVERAALRVDRRRRPDGGAGRSIQLRADRVLLRRPRPFGNRVGLPHLLAGRGIVRDHRSAERAAFVLRIRSGAFFERRDRHVQTSVVQRRRAGDTRQRMRFGALLPQQRAGLGVDGVDVGLHVAEVGGVMRAPARPRLIAVRTPPLDWNDQ